MSLYLLILPAPARGQEAAPAPSQDPDRAWALAGADIYAVNCQPCHGPEGKGDGPVMADQDHAMRDFTDPAQLRDRSPAEWVEVTRTGRIEALMPPWANQLTPEEIWDVVAFLWQLARTEEELAQGAALWSALRNDLLRHGFPPPDTSTWAYQALALTPEAWRTVFPADFDLPPATVLTAAELDLLHRFLQSQVLIPAWAPPLRQGTADLTGWIQPRSPGQQLPASLPVRLTAATGATVLQELQTTLDAQHRFAFRNLDPSPRLDYQVHVQLADLAFASPAAPLSAPAGTTEIPLDVFSPTASADSLEVRRLHVILSVGADRILVGQTIWLVNDAPYVFTGHPDPAADHPVTARIPLAPGAAELTIAADGENRFALSDEALLDSQPVHPAPADNWITVGYSLPLPPVPAQWNPTWAYPLRNVTVQINDLPGLSVRLPGLIPTGQETLNGQSFSGWQADSLPGDGLAVYFDALPNAPALIYQMPRWMPWAVAGFLLALMAAALFRPRRLSPRPPG